MGVVYTSISLFSVVNNGPLESVTSHPYACTYTTPLKLSQSRFHTPAPIPQWSRVCTESHRGGVHPYVLTPLCIVTPKNRAHRPSLPLHRLPPNFCSLSPFRYQCPYPFLFPCSFLTSYCLSSMVTDVIRFKFDHRRPTNFNGGRWEGRDTRTNSAPIVSIDF